MAWAKKYDPSLHHRRSIRLSDYDYSQCGLYFVTLCCNNRKCLFGDVANGVMQLNDAGRIAYDHLNVLSEKYPGRVVVHEFVVMPNHLHVILEIIDTASSLKISDPVLVGAIHESPLHESPLHESPSRESPLSDGLLSIPNRRDQRRKMLLSKIIGRYKMNTAKQINLQQGTSGQAVWQRDYFEHIIRNEKSFRAITEYIRKNPTQWSGDRFYQKH